MSPGWGCLVVSQWSWNRGGRDGRGRLVRRGRRCHERHFVQSSLRSGSILAEWGLQDLG